MATWHRGISAMVMALALLAPVPAHAQAEPSADPESGGGLRPSLAVGVGPGTAGTYLHTTLAVGKGDFDVLGRVSYIGDAVGSRRDAVTFALMAGRRWGASAEGSWIRVAAGPAVVNTEAGRGRGSFDDDGTGGFGLQTDFELGMGFEWASFTLGVHSSVNSVHSYAAAAIGVALGPIGPG